MIRIHRSLESVPADPRPGVVTVGSFDGVHLGHRKIIEKLTGEAGRSGGRSIVVTFDPHPQSVLRRNDSTVAILTTVEERAAELEKLGVDLLVVLEFTAELADIRWQEFCRQLIASLGMTHLIVGHDHAFGKGREGTVEKLEEFGAFGVSRVGPYLLDGETISSSKIRRALGAGDLEKANRYLGRPYSLQGNVVRGDGRGRKLGIPTANIAPLHAEKMIPANGVYCVGLAGEGIEARGMANLGVRPTFTEGTERTIEAHLFDFDRDIYEQVVTLEFRKFVRSERKFESAEAFLAQLAADRAVCSGE
jgi:riboflavin kinase/FMN adenylyltransferase